MVVQPLARSETVVTRFSEVARHTVMNTNADMKVDAATRPTGAARSMLSVGGAITFLIVPSLPVARCYS
jgi:hypothetical protein